jgi:nitroreductase
MIPDDLAALIRTRRSSLLIDAQREVPRDIVEELLELVTWAPNHKRTWPWRLAVLTGDSRRTLGESIADVMAAQGDDAPKVEKTRTKYLRSPIVIALGAAPGDSAERTAENRYAVAAGAQNLLLAAHAHGLAALWGSPMRGANAAINTVCRFPDDTEVLGLVYLGWPTGSVETPGRPAPDVNWL